MDWILFFVMVVHLLLCPFCKVEESFNLQAMHDILFLGHNISRYDHLEFPGVVPRTYVGPLLVTGLAFPFSYAAGIAGLSKLASQYIVRFVLGILVLWPLSALKQTLAKYLGKELSVWFTLISATQFHFAFYMSRPLPNTFALILVLLAFNFWLKQQHDRFILTSAAAIIIFRGELSILLGLILLGELFMKRLTFARTLKVGIVAAILSLSLTVSIDSFFWRRILWPEGEVLYFNIYLNKSSDWGTSPFLWYFYSALPRALGTSIAFIPVGLWLEKRTRPMIWPAVAFVLLYSLLPHKELRFIIYVVPLLNVAAAVACSRIWENRLKGRWHALMALIVVGHLLLNIVLTSFLSAVSFYNYPGGMALQKLHELEPASASVSVHIDNLAAQTGVSRFGQLNDNWIYDKTENLKAGSKELQSFSHLIFEAKTRYSHKLRSYQDSHEIIAAIEGFSHIHAGYTVFPPIRIRTKPCLFILKNKSPPLSRSLNFTQKRRIDPEVNDPQAHEDKGGLEKLLDQDQTGETEADVDYDFEFTNHFEGDLESNVNASEADYHDS